MKKLQSFFFNQIRNPSKCLLPGSYFSNISKKSCGFLSLNFLIAPLVSCFCFLLHLAQFVANTSPSFSEIKKRTLIKKRRRCTWKFLSKVPYWKNVNPPKVIFRQSSVFEMNIIRLKPLRFLILLYLEIFLLKVWGNRVVLLASTELVH